MVRWLKYALVVLALLAGTTAWAQGDGLTVSPDGPEAVKVFYTEAEAVAKVFAQADSLWTEDWRPTTAELTTLSRGLGWQIQPGLVRFHRGSLAGRNLGCAVVVEEQGRFKPITFLVKVSPVHEVEMVLVMVYRESRGEGVKRQRFLKQFRRKDRHSSLRLNRDIVGVSGATMSSRGITMGVKRVLALVDQHYGAKDAE